MAVEVSKQLEVKETSIQTVLGENAKHEVLA